MPQRIYMAIDLKSFYASVECVERGLDPLQTNLVVADPSRTEKTICLAVSPALKAYGIPGRARLFEVIQKVGQVNAMRRLNAPNRTFTGKSCDARELADHPDWALDYIIAPPQAHPAGRKRRAHRRAGRDALPPPAVGPHPADGFLAGGQGHRPKAGDPQYVHDG